jgi:hypothetical protein
MTTQNRSLVYYSTEVNEVYKYFAMGVKSGKINPNPFRFPIEPGELNDIVAFAQDQHQEILNPNALVVEVKSAWVEARELDARRYITITATIPTFNQSNTRWTPNGLKQTTLALVGMHVVGSVKGHAEMVWATFEHTDNAPVASYTYNNTKNQPVQVNANPRGNPGPGRNWLFSAHNCELPFNVARMNAQKKPFIDAYPNMTIGPTDTCRVNAWGSLPGSPGSATAAASAAENTQIIAINNSIMRMLGGDVRSNYLMVGTIWSNGVGTNRLANSTLETFEQVNSCFSCHKGDLQDGNLSHIFRSLAP